MNSISKFALGAVLALAFSCKQAEAPQEETAAATAEAQTTSAATSINKLPERQLVRTADIKFKVKDVAQSTYAIEGAVTRNGGLITQNNLQSHIDSKTQTKISRDSVLERTKYTVVNNLTLRIPNHQLDTVLQSISREIEYLDYRVLKADDVALQMLSNQLTQQRNSGHGQRMTQNIAAKGKKLDQISIVENALLGKNQESDNAAINNLSLRDQVTYSTVTLALYQNESVKSEMIAINPTSGAYGNFGLEILDSLKDGWYILERLISLVAQLWSVLLLGALAVFVFKKYVGKQKVVHTQN